MATIRHAIDYGWPHQQRRELERARVATGMVRCARGSDCFYAERVGGKLVGGLIRRGQAWDLGHDERDRSRYRGPEHRRCNRATSKWKKLRLGGQKTPKVALRSRKW